jgi:hypothetical protein
MDPARFIDMPTVGYGPVECLGSAVAGASFKGQGCADQDLVFADPRPAAIALFRGRIRVATRRSSVNNPANRRFLALAAWHDSKTGASM